MGKRSRRSSPPQWVRDRKQFFRRARHIANQIRKTSAKAAAEYLQAAYRRWRIEHPEYAA